MFLLKLISPQKVPRKKTDWKSHHKFYSMLLKFYLLFYSKGVIEDRIIVNEVVTLHSLRDSWFEKELSRFGISITPSLNAIQKETFNNRRYHRCHLFNWEDKLTVIHYGKDCCITRNKNVIFDTDMGGQIQTSLNSDAIMSIFFNGYRKGKKATVRKTDSGNEQQEDSEKHLPNESQPKKKKIHIKDTVKPTQESSQPAKPVEAPPQDTYIKHVGFEENDIF